MVTTPGCHRSIQPGRTRLVQRIHDFGLVCLVLEHLTSFKLLAETLARTIRPGGRIRIVDLHPERVAAGSLAHFHDGHTEVQFGLKAILDIKATRRGRLARGSSGY